MSNLDILRALTTPMSEAEAQALAQRHYGEPRENISLDDALSYPEVQPATSATKRGHTEDSRRQRIGDPGATAQQDI